MTKRELKDLVKEVLREELKNMEAAKKLTEAVEGPGYVIKAWSDAKQKSGIPTFDSVKKGVKYNTWADVLAALKTSELDELGAYEIIWVKSGEKLDK
jgi:hypothetical protein